MPFVQDQWHFSCALAASPSNDSPVQTEEDSQNAGNPAFFPTPEKGEPCRYGFFKMHVWPIQFGAVDMEETASEWNPPPKFGPTQSGSKPMPLPIKASSGVMASKRWADESDESESEWHRIAVAEEGQGGIDGAMDNQVDNQQDMQCPSLSVPRARSETTNKGKKQCGHAATPQRVTDQVKIQKHEDDLADLVARLKSNGKLEVASFIECFVAHLAAQPSGGRVGHVQETLDLHLPVTQTLANIEGYVVCLAFHPLGCFIVQAALEHLPLPVAQRLAAEMKGFVKAAIVDPHANHVLQKIIVVMPWTKAAFVVQELKGSAVRSAQHRFGCRVICRLVEHFAENTETVALMNEVVSEVKAVSKADYGKHVVNAVLEHGTPEQKHFIADTLCANGNLHDLIQCIHSRQVLVWVLQECSEEDRKSVSYELSRNMDGFLLVDSRKKRQHLVELIKAAMVVDPDSMRSVLEAIVPYPT